MIRRLLQLSPQEALSRGRQMAHRQSDRFRMLASPGWPADAAVFGAMDLSRPELARVREAVDERHYSEAAARLLEVFRERRSPRFYFDRGELSALTARISEQLPGAREAALRRGERALEGRVRLLGNPDVEVGSPIQWHRCPATGRKWPARFWADIDYLQDGADPKWVWELNRLPHWLDLARGFAFSGDHRFPREIAIQLESWLQQNPPSRGVNWGSSLEVAFRSMTWLWTMQLLLAADGLEPGSLMALLRGLTVGARYVQRYLSTYSSPNTHLMGEAAGLYLTGLMLPEFREARGWRSLGAQILGEELQAQFRADGAHFEQSAHYHRYAVDFYLHAALLAERNGAPLAEDQRAGIGRTMDFLATLARRDGSLPRLGDDDGGRVLFLGEEPVWDCRSSLALGAALLGRGDLKALCPELPEEAFWLLGTEGADRWESLSAEPVEPVSRGCEASGFHFLEGANGSQLLLKCGPQGWGRSGHGHADALAIEWVLRGEPVLVDPGTYAYGGPPAWRDYFRGTGAHNTVRIDGLDQAEIAGRFAFRDPVQATLRHRTLAPSWDLIEGSHPGYQRLAEPVEHRRAALLLKDDYLVICDLLRGAGEHRVEQLFHLAPGRVTLESESLVLRWEGIDGPGAAILPVEVEGLSAEILEGSEEPIGGWFSPVYGVRVPAPALTYTKRTALPTTMLTLLIPSATALPTRVERLAVNRAGLRVPPTEATGLRVDWEDYSDHLIISHAGAGPYSLGPVDMDGDFVFVRVGPEGRAIRAALGGGHSISWEGSPLCLADTGLETLTVDFITGRVEVEAGIPVDLKVCRMMARQATANGKRVDLDDDGGCVWLSLGK